jgi:hypothetical protein
MTKVERNDSRMIHYPRIAKPLKDSASVICTQKNRIQRHIPRKHNEKDTPKQYIKVILDLKSGNEQDTMFNNDSVNYYNYKEKNTNGLIDNCNINTEIESNSKPVTNNVSKSHERKRCIQKKLGSIKRQQSEELLTESIEDEKISEHRCRDCKFLKQNTNPEEPNNIHNNCSSQLKQTYDDYFIDILKQLIEKLDKAKQSKSLSRKDFLVQKSNELLSLKNKSAEKTNSSSEGELKLTFEKMKGNCIMDKLDFSPENISVNGKWVKNKIKGNKTHEFYPVIINLTNELIYKNKTTSRGDMNTFDDLINSNDQIIETNQDISDNLNNLKVTGTQENKEISISPILENNEHFLVTRETPRPLYLSFESKDKLGSTIIDDSNNCKFTTADLTDPFEKKKNSNHKAHRNQDKSLESITGNFKTTSNVELIKDQKFDINDKLKTKTSDEIVESSLDENDNPEELNSISVKIDNLNCSCNKKTIKNMSSTIMKNITEIKTDTYTSPKNFKVKGQKRSNKSQKTNDENIKENNRNETILIKNKNGLNFNLFEKNQIPFIASIKVDVPKNKKIQKSVLTVKDNNSQIKRGHKVNTNLQNILSENSDLKFEDQKKINNNEKTYNVDEIKNKRIPSIHKILSQKYPRNYIIQLKQNVLRKPQTDMKNSFETFNNKNKTNTNTDMTNSTSKILDRPQNKISSQILPQSIEKKSRKSENLDKNNADISLKNVVTKFKFDAPISSKIHTERNYGRYNAFSIPVDKKKNSMIVSPVSMQSITKPLFKTMSKKSNIGLDYNDVNITENNTRKLITGSYMDKTIKENIDNMKKTVNSRNSQLGLVKKIDNTKIYTGPKNTSRIIENDPTDEKRIIVNKTALQLNKSKPIQLIQTLNPLSITSQKKNNNIISKRKLKNSLNDRNITDILVSSISNQKLPIEKYDIFDKSGLVLRNKNTLNDDKTTDSLVFTKKNGSSPNLKKLKYESNLNKLPQAKLLKVPPTGDHFDHEHAPYKYDDLKPIIFNEATEKPKLSNRNSRLFFQHPSQQPLYGNKFHNTPDFNFLQSVPIIRPENDDYSMWTKNNGEEINIEKQQYLPELNLSSYDLNEDNISTSDFIKYDIKILDRKYFNQSKFEKLLQLKVNNSIFKIPLLGYTDYDNNNGSEYISDILIPIKKSNGQHMTISLTNLLTGNFHLLNRDNENSLAINHSSDMDSQLSASQTSIKNDGSNSDKTGKLCDLVTLKTFHANEEDNKQMVPIHIIQIINNGICSNNDTKIEKKYNRNKNLQNFRNQGKRVSSVRPKNLSNNLRKTNKKLENAYNHFDSEILDRFLQVYTPFTL